MVPRGTYRACIHVSCVFVFLLFPASSAEKLGKTSLHCQVLHGHNQKSLVSPVWRRKCWIRNLECFCGRALSKCRNKSLAADPNPWSLFMEEGRDCSSTFVSLVEPGQGENRHSIQCGASEVVTEPCSSVPQLVWQREQLGALTVSCLGCEREICNFMAGWLSHQPWGDGKKVRWQQQQALPDRMFWGGCWTDQTDDPELSLLFVWWWELRGRTAFLCANNNCIQVKRWVIITNFSYKTYWKKIKWSSLQLIQLWLISSC